MNYGSAKYQKHNNNCKTTTKTNKSIIVSKILQLFIRDSPACLPAYETGGNNNNNDNHNNSNNKALS